MPFDWWTAFQFDRAVTWFGRHIENKLHETHEIGKKIEQKYTLDQLLDIKKYRNNDESSAALIAAFGTGIIR